MRSHNNRPLFDICLDIMLFISFLILYEEHATGGSVHEWLGISIAVLMITHIVLHFKWITCLFKNFFGNLSALNRIKLILNLLIFFSFSTIVFSGLMMSREVLPLIGINAYGVSYWKWLHFTAVDLTLWLTALHIALNWQRLAILIKRSSFLPSGQTNKIQPENIITRDRTTSPGVFKSSFIKYTLTSLLIIVLAGSVAFLWYGISDTPFAYSREHFPLHENSGNHRQEFREPFRDSGFKGLHAGNHRRNGSEGYHEVSLTGILPGAGKNVLIIFTITLGVFIAGKGIKKSPAGLAGEKKMNALS